MAAPLPLFEGKYEIIAKLKEGGMGAVYKVRHRLLDEVRVIKLIRPHLESDEAVRARFLREARTAVRLRHPNIAQFYDFSMDDDGNAFIVMEFIDGVTLEELLAKVGPPPLPLGLEIAEQSLRSLAYLHRRNIIHRDISPDNLMLSRTEEGLPLVKLIDLGIAKVLEEEGHSQITRRGLTGTGMFLGKVRYASPEQFHPQEGVAMDARSDLYSFGLVLYELLTGVHPIRGSSVPSFIAGHLFHPPVPFEESDPTGRVPADLRQVVLRALEKKPQERFASADAFIEALAPIKGRYPLGAQEAVVALDGAYSTFAEKTQVDTLASTQARLDRQFGMAPTPPPLPGSTPGRGESAFQVEVPSPPSAPLPPPPEEGELDATSRLQFRVEPGEQAQQMGGGGVTSSDETRVLVVAGEGPGHAALVAAGELAAQGRWREALETLAAAEDLEPHDPEVKALRERAEQGLAVEVQRAQRAAALAAHTRHIEELLDAGQLEQARLGLEAALVEMGREEALAALVARLAEAEEAQALAYRRQAEAALAGGRPAEAIEAVQQAIALRPDEESLRQLLQHAEAAQARERACEEAVKNITSALAAEDLALARNLLAEAVERLGDEQRFEQLRQRLENAELKAQTAKARELLAAAKQHMAEGRFELAQAAAEETLALRPGDLEAMAVLADVKAAEQRRAAEQRAAAERQAAEQRLAAERLAAVEEIRRLLQQGLWTEATEAVQTARIKYGNFVQLEEAERDLQNAWAQQKQEVTLALVQEAQRLAATQQFVAAEAKLEEAKALSPADERVRQTLAEVRRASRRFHEAQERSRAVAEEANDIARALAAGDLEGAAQRFDSAVRKHGERPELGELRQRLRAARRAEEERRADARQAARPVPVPPAQELERAPTIALQPQAAGKADEGAPEPTFERAPTQPLPVAERRDIGFASVPPLAAETPARPRETTAPVPTLAAVLVAKHRRWWTLAAVAAAVTVVVVAGLSVRRSKPTRGPTPTAAGTVSAQTPVPVVGGEGVLVVSAVPWGEIISIRRQDGGEVRLPAQRVTPLRLSLAVGRYAVTVRDPLTGSRKEAVVEVRAKEAARLVVEVRAVTADELLRRLGWSG